MATMYKTPGVYIEEIPKFPPSIAPVETAIPAFIGYTERALDGNIDLKLKPTRITSLLEYETYFGTSNPERFRVDVNFSSAIANFQVDIAEKPNPAFFLHHALKAFYANGGGPCYIVSVGTFLDGKVDINSILIGLDAAKAVDEVTMLISPESVMLSHAHYGNWATQALKQCAERQDRFAVLDVSDKYKTNAEITSFFRNFVPSVVDETKYGAAYYPFVEASFPYRLNDASGNNISFVRQYTVDGVPIAANNALVIAASAAYTALTLAESNYLTELADQSNAQKTNDLAQQILTTHNALVAIIPALTVDAIKVGIYDAVGQSNVPALIQAAATLPLLLAEVTTFASDSATDLGLADTALTAALSTLTTIAQPAMNTASNALIAVGDYSMTQISKIKDVNNVLYNLILDKITASGVVLPPSSLIAGIYATVDNNRGVWKAPANVSVAGIIRPTIDISEQYQGDLNVDTLAGKSVNALRSFLGKGTLVWGARTLAGNDLEWRYVPVRRLFNFVEESVKKATEQFVFEPNDANTWVRVQAMIENFLNTLWRQGALQGIKPEHAFYVAVGLGKTMTAVDILEGRMIVEIGMAAVRPAEFIILRFSHKLAES